jgi:hypothetical protein
MLDHDPTHKRQLLASSQMPSFFADLADQYQGRKVYVHSGSLREDTGGSEQPPLLAELSFARQHRKDTLTIRTVQAGELSETTIDANLVWVIRDHDSHLVAVEIIDEQDRTLVLEYH